MIACGYTETGFTLATGPFLLITVQSLSQIDSQGCFAHMGLAYKKIGMGKALALQTASQ
jgi:hypothetical protein